MVTMLKQLKVIKADPTKIKEPFYGICWMLSFCSDYEYEKLIRAFGTWDEFSGSNPYPVPHNTLPPKEAYMGTDKTGLWDKNTSYGAARWRLVDHLIKEFSK